MTEQHWHPDYWCNLNKMQELFGYSPNALRCKITRQQWPEGDLWCKTPDNRLVMNPLRFSQWLASNTNKRTA